ncbi:GDSL-type esterase/lipase family protein [Alkalibacterium pelagium]|uniref:Lysophospholipase L1 n=1 Tax=Alkalibacterium pelagium TaxID=426702 RepID=A0A1H7LAW2_9LACT|nr:GDSL-type esterase/lipase family protein [Alkalibacterium pelagium]GEN50938.1 hypothetical protein APE02nite_16030 [Alkalibacterium pelagium]SEK96018.1 Lysophospholipase L1 [Alkalibacterium pelagium]
MKKKKRILLLLITVALLASITYIGLPIIGDEDEGVQEEDESELVEEPVPQEEINNIVILGDSIGSGVGDQESSGIGDRYLELMDRDGDEILTNLAISGYTSSQLVDLIETGENNATIAEADLIIISIGGNDLNRLAFQRDLDLPVAFEDTLNAYLENLETIIGDIRTQNSEAEIALIGLYNPYSLIIPELSDYLVEWNDDTRSLVESHPGSTYVPTFDLFQDQMEDFLYTDYFHPNEEGYQAIAEQLYTLIN